MQRLDTEQATYHYLKQPWKCSQDGTELLLGRLTYFIFFINCNYICVLSSSVSPIYIHTHHTTDIALRLTTLLCNCQTGCRLTPTASSCGISSHHDVSFWSATKLTLLSMSQDWFKTNTKICRLSIVESLWLTFDKSVCYKYSKFRDISRQLLYMIRLPILFRTAYCHFEPHADGWSNAAGHG